MSRIGFAWSSDLDGIDVPVYMGQAYQRLLADHDHSETRVLACTVKGKTVYLPMLVRDLGNGLKEAYSAYGYGGLLGKLPLSEDDVREMRRFLSSKSIIAVFIRHSPFLENNLLLPNKLIEINRRTYAKKLNNFETIGDYLKTVSSQLRRHVNIAIKNDLCVRITPLSEVKESKVSQFYQIYKSLMQRKEASGYYLFSEKFFLDHIVKLMHSCDLVEVIKNNDEKQVAAAFFLKDQTGFVHYHLGAGSGDATNLQAMKLLFASSIYLYGQQGFSFMHLGGGHLLDESDGLSRFKLNFADIKLDFFCSKIICDDLKYESERLRQPLLNPRLFLISDARGDATVNNLET